MQNKLMHKPPKGLFLKSFGGYEIAKDKYEKFRAQPKVYY